MLTVTKADACAGFPDHQQKERQCLNAQNEEKITSHAAYVKRFV